MSDDRLPPLPLLSRLAIIDNDQDQDIIFREVHSAAMARGARCDICSLKLCARGPVPSTVVPGATMAVSGEGPGGKEIREGENFIGDSGFVLNESVAIGGQFRPLLTVINVIACRHSDNEEEGLEEWLAKSKRRAKRKFTMAKIAEIALRRAAGEEISERDEERELASFQWISPIEACRPRFERDLDETGAKVLLAVGKFALVAMEEYIRSRGWYTGDELVMARVHGAPIPLAANTDAVGNQEHARLAIEDEMQALMGVPKPADVTAISAYGSVPPPLFMFGAYHPAYAARDPKWDKFVRANITRAAEVATRGWINWSEPQYIIDPPLEFAVDWLRWIRESKQEFVVIDLETCDPETGKPSADAYTNDLRCIGMGVRFPQPDGTYYESVAVFPVRHMDGSWWQWSEDDRRYAAAYLAGDPVTDPKIIASATYEGRVSTSDPDACVRGVLYQECRRTCDAIQNVGHNAMVFDTPIMIRLGLLSPNAPPVIDTLLCHHNTPSQDHSHSLSFAAREYLEVPAWKSKEDIASTDNADDEKLKLRCARDVLVTARLLDPLLATIRASQTTEQNKADHVAGQIERDIGDMGLCVDERVRGFWSRTLTNESQKLLSRWYELVGKKVNPRAPQQMQTLLYEEWGLDPVISTTGLEWKWETEEDNPIEDDEGSTSVPAILALIAKGPLGDTKEQHERRSEALNAFLEYKALDKPLTTYVHTDVRPWPRDSWSWRLVDNMIAAEGGLEARPEISRIRAIYSMGRTPIGRAAGKKPPVQQIPKQGRKVAIASGTPIPPNVEFDRWDGSKWVPVLNEKGKSVKTKEWCTFPFDIRITANMRSMIRPAPGHKLVGSDYLSSHIRIYGAHAQDDLIYDIVLGKMLDGRGNKVDAHSFNSATINAGRDGMDLWTWYDAIQYAPERGDKDFREYWRFVAKKFAFACIYGAVAKTIYDTMRAERRRDTGKLAFPGISLHADCEPWHEAWHYYHPWTAIWQQREIELYQARGYACGALFEQRKRFGPLEHNQIPNTAILSDESALRIRALQIIESYIPHRSWSDWTGIVYDGHDSIVVQVPDEQKKVDHTIEVVGYAMAYDWRGMPFRGDPRQIVNLGDM